MRKRLLAFLILLLGGVEPGFARTSIELYPLNVQSRWEQTEEQDLQPRSALNFAFGGTRFGWGLLFEYSKFDVVSGGEYSGIQRNHEEALIWGRKESARFGNMFILGALGTGFARETVDTRFGEESVVEPGQTKVLLAISGGAGFELQKVILFSLEGRLFYGGASEPSVQPDLIVRTGLKF